jgi:hypothetical protein
MDDVDVRIKQLALEGRCCTQIMVQIALQDSGRDDPVMVDAVGALCLGLYSGDCCGALSGGALAMALLAARPLDTILVTELAEWFRETHGATRCDTLLAGDAMARFTRCPAIVEATYREAVEILDCHGLRQTAGTHGGQGK